MSHRLPVRNSVPLLASLFVLLAAAGCHQRQTTASAPGPAALSLSERNPGPDNVLLIGWDAVQREHLKECISRDEVPNLIALSREGSLMAIDITTGKTDTKAGWTQILTGYDPGKTGVYNNKQYRPIPEGYTLLERFERRFAADDPVTVFVAAKKNHVGALGPHIVYPGRKRPVPVDADPSEFPTEADLGQSPQDGIRMEGEPYFITQDHIDLFENGLSRADRVGERALALLEQYRDRRFFFFIHFASPDHEGHRFGENSPQYTEGIITNDQWLERIVRKLRELGLYDTTRIYVVSDHGFDEGKTSHSNAPYVFFATNDPMVGNSGDRKDVAPTILWRLGFDLESIDPPLDGKPLRKADASGPVW